MAPQPVDVLIFEDNPDQVKRIADWFGLAPFQYKYSLKFAQANASGRRPNEEAEQGWEWVQSEIRRTDPKVVVFDYLLSKNLGSQSFDGLHYGKLCKGRDFWPELGIVLVTTGGDGDQTGQIREQLELDNQRVNNKWPIDYAWIKPWGTARSTATNTKVQTELKKLVHQSRRPSEHTQGK